DEVITVLFDELARQGFVEGKNLTVDYRAWVPNHDLISEYAAEFVQAHVDVIAAGGDTAIRAAQKVTRTIPIFATTDDMVGAGFVSSMARPEGNRPGSASSRPSLTASDRKYFLKQCRGFAAWQSLLIPTRQQVHGWGRSKMRRAHAMSSPQFIVSLEVMR